MSLERRYRILLRAYPRAYRAQRGDEITATYLDLAGPARRWPAPGDVVDALTAGIRERLRANGATGAIAGLRLAAVLALCGSAALAARDLLYSLPPPGGTPWPGLPFGPFATIAVIPDAAWVLAGLAAAASTRLARALTGVALLLTVSIAPAAALTGHFQPPLTVLIPQFALGLMALALPRERRGLARLAPALAAPVVPVLILVRFWFQRPNLTMLLLRARPAPPTGPLAWRWWFHWYPGVSQPAEQKLAIALIVGTLAADLVWVARWRDGRGVWAALLLLQPAALLWLVPLAFGPANPQLAAVIVFTGVITALSVALFLLAVKLKGLLTGKLDRLLAEFDARRAELSTLLVRSGGHSQGQCPACGQPLPPGVSPAAPPDQQRGMGLV